MPTRLALLAGILAPLLYGTAVVLGGVLTPGYSHVAHPISALIEAGAPAKPLLDALFAAYNLLLILFAAGLHPAFARSGVEISPVAPGALVLIGILGLVMWPLPMDAIGTEATARGNAHVFIAGLQAVATLIAVVSLAISVRPDAGLRRLSNHSMVTAIVLFAAGGLTAAAASHQAPLTGLAERITICAFMQWLFVLAIAAWRLSAGA